MPATLALLVLDDECTLPDASDDARPISVAPESTRSRDQLTGVPDVALQRAVATLRSVPAITEIAVIRPSSTPASAFPGGTALPADVRVVSTSSPAADDVARAAVVLAGEGAHERVLLLAARHALTPADQIGRVVAALAGGAPVAVPALPVVDTISVVEAGWVTGTIDRTTVRAVCGPWGFTTTALAAAVEAHGRTGAGADTDRLEPLDTQWRRLGALAAGSAGVTVVSCDPAGASLADPVTRAHLAVTPADRSAGTEAGDGGSRDDRDRPAGHGGDADVVSRSPEAPSAETRTPAGMRGSTASGGSAPIDIGTGRTERPGTAPRAAAVVLAAGSGTRFGAPVNKAYLPLGGSIVLAHSLRRFAALDEIGTVVLVIREQDTDRARAVIEEIGDTAQRIEVVIGDATRQGSELAALRHLTPRIDDGTIDVVALHDSARPLADAALCRALLDAARRDGGAVPGTSRPELAVVDPSGATLLGDTGGPLVAVQTPQVFTAAPLLAAYEAALAEGFEGTDTAGVIAHATGRPARWVPAPSTNLKITYAGDLPIAELLLTQGRSTREDTATPD